MPEPAISKRPDEPAKKLEPLRFDDPLFIAAAVAAVAADVITIGSMLVGVILLPLAGIGLAPIAIGLVMHQAIAFSLLGYVFAHMKSPRDLMPDVVSTIEAPEVGIFLLLFRPWVIMLLAAGMPFLPLLTLALFLAVLANNKLINTVINIAQTMTNPFKAEAKLAAEAEGVMAKSAAKEIGAETEKIGEQAAEKAATPRRRGGSSLERDHQIKLYEDQINHYQGLAGHDRVYGTGEYSDQYEEMARQAKEKVEKLKNEALDERLNTGSAELKHIENMSDVNKNFETPDSPEPNKEDDDETIDLRG